jgi:non-specific serine/threonine protein kinase
VTRAEREQSVHRAAGNWTPLTSFVGRVDEAAELTRLLESNRLVTVTGPGGVGKTRLAIEVARRVEDSFPDGVWLIDLGHVTETSRVAAEVMSALGVKQDPRRPPLEVLAEVLAPWRLLLILDNCEHVLPAVADLCGALLTSADDVQVLGTSREQLGVGGESRYRLSPLELPGSGELQEVGRSAAATLFTDRARQSDPGFTLDAESAPQVARVVTRLDGMPLAIELAAARVEALGLAGLADRMDDALQLLHGRDLLAADRHRSLAMVADWSYQLLTEPEQRVFRRLAVFPGPFTLAAAEAVAGADAGPSVLRLVDCSLLVPPRPGTDQRTRYTMLQTLRAYAHTRLTEAGEVPESAAALVAYACSVAEQAAAELDTADGETDALRWLDAEDATLSRALPWAIEHHPADALRLASALAPWLRLRGRLVEARTRLSAAVEGSAQMDETWATAQLWLGHLASDSNESAEGVDRHTAVVDAYRAWEPSPVLVRALASGRAIMRLNRGDVDGAVADARSGLAVAREIGDVASELLALAALSLALYYSGDTTEALERTQQARELLPSDIPGWVARWCHYIIALVLNEAGDLDATRQVCAAGLSLARQVDDLTAMGALLGVMGDVERSAGNLADAGAHLREAVGIASRIGSSLSLTNLIEQCGYPCAEAGRWADATTLWAAMAADRKRRGRASGPVNDGLHSEYLRRAEQALAPDRLQEAQDRGARMPVSAAAELAIMVTSAVQDKPSAPAPGKVLSPRERELVTLVAQGHTNAQIADRLYISVHTVTSHLDRIREKTGYRRRADLTRLAIAESLV